MNTMKLRYLMAAALLVLIFPFLNAQVSVTCNEVKQKGNQLVIDAVITVNGDDFSRREQITLTPMLTSSAQQMGLPTVMLNGKVTQKVYNREVALNNLDIAEPYVVVPVKKGANVIDYKLSVPFESWMKGSQLVLIPDLCGCGKNNVGDPLFMGNVQTRPDKPYEVIPTLVYILPEVELVKQRAEIGSAFLDFPVAKWNILPDFRNNASELSKIDNTIETVVNDENITLNGLILTGYASPEGSYAFNKLLAENRVKALQGYIQKKHDFKADLFKISSVAEDWDGFRAAVQNDQAVPARQQVLDIINNADEVDVKERKLKELDGGVAYRYVLDKIFPSLRRSVYQVDYTVREFNVEEACEIIKVNPKQLSLNEMFAVANTYEVGSSEYNEVFEIAVQRFPEDPVANLNAANIALATKDLTAAAAYLEKAGNSPEALNARGVLAMLQGNYDLAYKLLQQAQSAGVKDAAANLQELNKKKADIELFNSFD